MKPLHGWLTLRYHDLRGFKVCFQLMKVRVSQSAAHNLLDLALMQINARSENCHGGSLYKHGKQ
jgi:hypothetical protein